MLDRVQEGHKKYILINYTSDYKLHLIALDLLPLSMVIELADLILTLPLSL